MKRLLYLAVFTTFFSCRENLSSGEGSNSSGDETTTVDKSYDKSREAKRDLESIDDLRMEYSKITSKIESGSVDSTSFDYNCRDEIKGTLIYYSEKDQLRKITHTYNEYSHFSATDEYFLKDDALFFVLSNHLVWSFVNQDQTRENTTERRFYIVNNQLIKCLQKKFTVLSNEKNDHESNMVPNKEVECSSTYPILKDFELLFKLRTQTKDIECLDVNVTQN